MKALSGRLGNRRRRVCASSVAQPGIELLTIRFQSCRRTATEWLRSGGASTNVATLGSRVGAMVSDAASIVRTALVLVAAASYYCTLIRGWLLVAPAPPSNSSKSKGWREPALFCVYARAFATAGFPAVALSPAQWRWFSVLRRLCRSLGQRHMSISKGGESRFSIEECNIDDAIG